MFIKGMGHDVHKPDLEKLFADIGHIKAIRMKKDKFTGQPKVGPGTRLGRGSWLASTLCWFSVFQNSRCALCISHPRSSGVS